MRTDLSQTTLQNSDHSQQSEASIELLRKHIAAHCIEFGLNTAHDFDGVNNIEDMIIYHNAITEKLRKALAK